MPDLSASVHAYVAAFAAADASAAAALFAADAVLEDPVGTPPREGSEAILAFYQGAMQTGATLTLTGPIRQAADAVAFCFTVHINPPGAAAIQIDIIDVFRFNDAGKIRSMQAFWGPANVRTG
jgi:steroid Delta-isomerase